MSHFNTIKGVNILLFFLLLGFTSCNNVQEPTFERVENVKIRNVSTQQVESDLDLVFNNPNSFALDLAKADLTISMDDVELGEIHQTYDAAMSANSDFNMPIHINLDLRQLYGDNVLEAMSKGLELMKKRELELRFEGAIHVGHGQAKIKVPVDRVKTIQF